MRASASPARSSAPTPFATTLASPDAAFAQSPLGQALMHVLTSGSASQRQIADYLLRNQMRVTALGIEELADSCQVSTATISRFARDIGQKNYSAMRGAMAETLQSLLQPVDKLRRTIERRARATSPITESLEYAAANIAATSDALSPPAMQAVVRRLTRAKVVYVMGFGLSANLAGMLVQHLQPFCPHVVEVVGIGGSEVAAGHLVNLTAHDVLVVISFPPLHARLHRPGQLRARPRRLHRGAHRLARVAPGRTCRPRAVRAKHASRPAQQRQHGPGHDRGAGRGADGIEQEERRKSGPLERSHRRLSVWR